MPEVGGGRGGDQGVGYFTLQKITERPLKVKS